MELFHIGKYCWMRQLVLYRKSVEFACFIDSYGGKTLRSQLKKSWYGDFASFPLFPNFLHILRMVFGQLYDAWARFQHGDVSYHR